MNEDDLVEQLRYYNYFLVTVCNYFLKVIKNGNKGKRGPGLYSLIKHGHDYYFVVK